MRSPWQLIKGLASRRKSDEAGAPADEVVAIPELRAEEFDQSSTQRTELEANPRTSSQSTGDAIETDQKLASIGADAEQTLPATQTDPSPSRVAENTIPEVHDKPAPVTPAVQTSDGEGGTGAVTAGSNKRGGKAAQARETRGKPTVGKAAIEHPVAAKKTAREEAAELDREIKSLRLQLSAKLLEQNTQLRLMIERYGEK